MTRARGGQLVFWCAVALAAALYGVTAPAGLPWNASMRLAAAYLDGLNANALPVGALPHPIWGFHVQAFGGAVTLAILMAALAAGLLGALVNRYFGWRLAASAALVWIFLPSVWNRAITGERSVCLMAMFVVAAWVLNAAVLWFFRKVERGQKKRAGVPRMAGWVTLGSAGIFALASLSLHDYALGEAASVFARGLVDAAGARIIVADGIVDEQVEREVERWERGKEGKLKGKVENGKRGSEAPRPHPAPSTKHQAPSTQRRIIFLKADEGRREKLVAWVKREWPAETNLWIAAHVSAAAFVEAAVKKHPECFYLMNGTTTTREQWERRWADFKPCLKSRDAFVSVGRRYFGHEGNALANALWAAGQSREAYALYKRIYEEVDPGNISALINRGEMMRRGYAAGSAEKTFVQERLDTFFANAHNRKFARALVRTAGPVRTDPEMMEKMAAEATARIAAKIANGEPVAIAPELLSLVEWNNEMVARMEKGDVVKAGRIARTILSNPKWRGFLPANATMGVVSAYEGDYVASAAFFRTAIATTNAIPAAVFNDYADTLMHLGELDAAEEMARRAVKGSDETYWLARLTLVEVLERKVEKWRSGCGVLGAGCLVRGAGEVQGESPSPRADVTLSKKREQYHSSTSTSTLDSLKVEDEIRARVKSILQYAPEAWRERIRKTHREFAR